MRIVIDTCVIMDFATGRDVQLSSNAKMILANAYRKQYQAFITSNTVTDLYYLFHHVLKDKTKSINYLLNILDYVRILDVNETDCRNAAYSEISDFEDAVLEQSAKRNKVDYIVTDNLKDFKKSIVKALSSEDFLKKTGFVVPK